MYGKYLGLMCDCSYTEDTDFCKSCIEFIKKNNIKRTNFICNCRENKCIKYMKY